jgi:L-amino acid N-acyltransferase YncA
MQAIGSCYEDGTIRGVVGYDHWSGPSIDMHWAGEGRFLNREFLWAMFAYPFKQLDCKIAVAYVESANVHGVKVAKHLGFDYLTTIPDGAESGDMVILTMRPHQCKWWRKNHGRLASQENDEEGHASATAGS